MIGLVVLEQETLYTGFILRPRAPRRPARNAEAEPEVRLCERGKVRESNSNTVRFSFSIAGPGGGIE